MWAGLWSLNTSQELALNTVQPIKTSLKESKFIPQRRLGANYRELINTLRWGEWFTGLGSVWIYRKSLYRHVLSCLIKRLKMSLNNNKFSYIKVFTFFNEWRHMSEWIIYITDFQRLFYLIQGSKWRLDFLFCDSFLNFHWRPSFKTKRNKKYKKTVIS